jgi:ferredoxin
VIHLKVHGLASGTIVAEFPLSEQELDTDLLTLLRSKDIPIASSCLGEGVCRKCLINDDLMACITKSRELLSQGKTVVHIKVSYL